jgi:hypothetical protein
LAAETIHLVAAFQANRRCSTDSITQIIGLYNVNRIRLIWSCIAVAKSSSVSVISRSCSFFLIGIDKQILTTFFFSRCSTDFDVPSSNIDKTWGKSLFSLQKQRPHPKVRFDFHICETVLLMETIGLRFSCSSVRVRSESCHSRVQALQALKQHISGVWSVGLVGGEPDGILKVRP